MYNTNGWSIIEVITVCVVIGILVTLAIPNYARSVERAQCATALQTLQTLRQVALDWHRENETFTMMTIDNLEAQGHTQFPNNAPDIPWSYDISTTTPPTNTTITLEATRQGGPHNALIISIDQDGTFGGTYPFNNPGDF